MITIGCLCISVAFEVYLSFVKVARTNFITVTQKGGPTNEMVNSFQRTMYE
jgi:hypothetical protein